MLAYDSSVPAILQTADWTCSACSLAWLNQALSIDYATDEWSAVNYIGDPENINSAYGLMDSSGARLAECLLEQGAPAFTVWPSWSTIYRLAAFMPFLIGGVTWNHWVAVRGVVGENLAIANSAPGWMGVHDSLAPSSYTSLGPFAAVGVPLQRSKPNV